jgi:diguanylate cyclase (GGDEF)-like protein
MLFCCNAILRVLTLSSVLLCSCALASDVDVALEQALDNYVQLSQRDTAGAKALLQQLEQTQAENSALQSRARLLSYLVSDAYDPLQPETANVYLQMLMQLAASTENADALSEIYGTEIEVLLYQRKLNDAIVKADLLQRYLQRAAAPRIRYYFHSLLGRLFTTDGQYSQALQHYIDALEAVMETDNEATLRRRTYLNLKIAQVHAELKNWPQARTLAQSTLDECIKYQLSGFVPDLYLLQGFIAGSEKRFQDAIRINQQGITAALKNDDEAYALTFENNLGSAYIELAQYASAKAVLLRALERAERLKDQYSAQLIKMNLGYIRVMEGEHHAGIEQLKAGMQYFSNNASKAEYEPYYEWLAKAYAATGQYQLQAETLLEQMALQQEIRSADRESRLNELQNRYDTKAKAQQITILEQENSLNAQLLENKQLQQQLTLLFVLLMLFAAMSLFQLYRKVRQSNRKLYETNKQLAYQSQRDPLTGLYNRRALQQHMLLRSQKRREQDTKTSLTGLLLLDIDFFKRINDHYGHSAGDAVLIEISKRLVDTCREQDLVVRWGGEEVLLLLDNIVPGQISGFIQRILQAIADTPVQFEQHNINVSASGGFIHLPFAGISEQQLDWEKVMQIVDMALYLSKANGRNQVCVINELKVDFSAAESLLYTDLSGAIRAGMLDVKTITGPGGAVG